MTPSTEPAFQAELRDATGSVVRQVCTVLMATYPLWVGFDLWVQPAQFDTFTMLRGMGGAAAVATLVWGFRGANPHHALSLWLWTIAAPVAAMLAMVDGDVLVHYAVGYTIFLVGSGMLGLWSPRERLLVDGVLAAMAAAALLVRPHPAAAQDWLMSIGYLGTFALVARLIGQNRYQGAWREYQARSSLARAHAQLRRRDEQKTHFFQNISHELRTPLTLMLAPLDAAMERNPDPDLEVASRNGRRMLRLVNQLLAFQKLSFGRHVFRPRAVDAAAFATAAGDLVQRAAHAQELTLRVEVEPHLPSVHADVDALEKALFNLLSNALKFTPAGGTVTLRVEPVRGGVRFGVMDTGPGIAAEDQTVLFEVFSQVDSGTTRGFEGTGLGLALVKQLVEGMDGHVGVESTVGEGSTFWFTVPKAEGPGDPRATPQGSDWLLAELDGPTPRGAQPDVDPDGPGATVLVVEDLADMRALVAGMLRSAGHRVIEASDGARALERISHDCPDLIVTDWMMPTMSGLELLETLRADPHLATIPVVVLTAKADPNARLVGLETGADAFLGKPFERRELLSAVRNLLALKTREVELEDARAEAEAADRAKSTFLANMSHELRTPLTVILGYTQLLRESDNPEIDDDLARIESAAQYQLQLVADVLDLSKVAAGQLHVRRQPVAIPDLLAELCPVAESLCRSQNNTFEHAWPVDLPPAHGDPVRVRQILLNLLSNATKFTTDGTVAVHAGHDHEAVWISVTDTGIGLDDDQQAQLFQPFVQVHDRPHATFGGTGLGLSLSRQLARMMGGDIEVSGARGHGCTFTVTLPQA